MDSIRAQAATTIASPSDRAPPGRSVRSLCAGHSASRHAAPNASVFGGTGASELPNNAAAADAALVGIKFSIAWFDAATAALDPTSAEAVLACATAREAADAAPLARSAALRCTVTAVSATVECAWVTASDNLEVQPGPPILVLCANSKSGPRGVSCVEAAFAAIYLPRVSHCIKFQETYVPGARFRLDARSSTASTPQLPHSQGSSPRAASARTLRWCCISISQR